MKSFQHILHYALSLLLFGVFFSLSQSGDVQSGGEASYRVESSSGFSAASLDGALPVIAFLYDDDENQDEKRKFVKHLASTSYVPCSIDFYIYLAETISAYIPHSPLFYSGSSPPIFV